MLYYFFFSSFFFLIRVIYPSPLVYAGTRTLVFSLFLFFLIFKLPNNTNLSCQEGQPVCYRVAPRAVCVSVLARVFFPSFCSFKWTNYDYYYRMVGRREKERAREREMEGGENHTERRRRRERERVIQSGEKQRVLTHSHTSSLEKKEL